MMGEQAIDIRPQRPLCLVGILLSTAILLSLFLIGHHQPVCAIHHQLPLDTGPSGNGRPNEYQLIGEAGHQIRVPCLIGKQLYCGEPYFIAWYKLNVSSKSWIRFEHKSIEDNEASDSMEASSIPPEASSAFVAGKPLANRVRFDWSPRASQSGGQLRQQAANSLGVSKSAGPRSSICSDPSIFRPSTINNPQQLALDHANFDCAQLTISPLELSDEGQYKCEITFSESLDFDKCPATTLSQLTVIGKLEFITDCRARSGTERNGYWLSDATSADRCRDTSAVS